MSEIREFALPDLGEGLEEGEIVAWHVEVGDVVTLNQVVADIETAKALVEVPSPFAGRIVERVGELGESLPVGTVILRIDVTASDASTPAPPDAGDAPAESADAPTVSADAPTGTVSPAATVLDAEEEPQPLVGYGQDRSPTRRRRTRNNDGAPAPTAAARPLAKPPVRLLARELGIDLAELAPGSGPQGSITREDLRAHQQRRQPAAPAAGTAEATTPAPVPAPTPAAASPLGAASVPATTSVPGFRGRQPGEVEAVRGIRRRIVDKMEVSRREIPSASCSRDADLTEAWELRHDLTALAREQGLDVKITPLALVLRAVVVALRRFPTLNARMHDRGPEGDGEIRLLEPIHLGVATDTDRGLVVPVIHDAHQRSLVDLAAHTAMLAGKAREGTITPGELTGGTFTVNNYGPFGIDAGEPIINHPEGAILGIGAIRERPWVVDGELTIRRIARFTLVFDHRLSDGGEAGRFVSEVVELCERPGRLLLHL